MTEKILFMLDELRLFTRIFIDRHRINQLKDLAMLDFVRFSPLLFLSACLIVDQAETMDAKENERNDSDRERERERANTVEAREIEWMNEKRTHTRQR